MEEFDPEKELEFTRAQRQLARRELDKKGRTSSTTQFLASIAHSAHLQTEMMLREWIATGKPNKLPTPEPK